MESRTLKSCFSGRFPDDSLQRTGHIESSCTRGSSRGSSTSSILLPREEERNTHRDCAFRADSLRRCSLVQIADESAIGAAVVQEDGVAAMTALRTAGRLQVRNMSPVRAVNNVSLAPDDTRAGMNLCGVPALVHPESAVEENVPFHSTTAIGLPLDVAVQQQLQVQQQCLLSRKHQQPPSAHHQLRGGRLSLLRPQRDHTQRQTLTPQHVPAYSWLQLEQLQVQHVFQKQQQDEQPHLPCLRPPDGRERICHSAVAAAPRLAAANRVAPPVAQKASSEPTETACPFDRLRVLQRSNRYDTASNDPCAAAGSGAQLPEPQSYVSAEFPQESAVPRGRERTQIAPPSLIPAEVPGEVSREAMVPATCAPKTVSAADYDFVGDTAEIAAYPTASETEKLDTDEVVRDTAGSAAAANTSEVHLYTPPAFSAPKFCMASPAVNYSQVSMPSSGVDSYTASRTGTASPLHSTHGSFLCGAVSSVQSDVPHEYTLSCPVASALVQPAEATTASLRAPAASTAGVAERCKAYASAEHLRAPPTAAIPAKATAAGSPRGSPWLHGGGSSLRRSSVIVNGRGTPSSESNARTAPGGEVGSPSLACMFEKSDAEPAGSSEFCVLSDEVHRQGGEVSEANHVCIGEREKIQGHQPRGTHVFGEDPQQADNQAQQQTRQQQATHLLGEQHLHKNQCHSQNLEKCEAVAVQQRDDGEDVGAVHESQRHGDGAFADGTDLPIPLRGRRRSDLQGKLCFVLSGAAATAGREYSCVSGSGRLLYKEAPQLKVGASEDDVSCSTVEQGAEKTRSCLYIRTSCSASKGDHMALTYVSAPPRCSSKVPGFNAQPQAFTSPVPRAPPCSATVAPITTASCDTTDSGFASGSPTAAARAAAAVTSAAEDYAAPVIRSTLTLHPVPRCPPRALFSLGAAEPSLPTCITPAVSQRCHTRLRSHAAYSAEAAVSTVPECAPAARCGFSPRASTGRVRNLSFRRLGNGAPVNAEGGASPATSFATGAVQGFPQRSAEKASLPEYTAESCSLAYLFCPLKRNCSPVSPPRSKRAPGQCTREAVYESRTPAVAPGTPPFPPAVGCDVAVGANGRNGFPSYPTGLVGCDFRQRLLPTEAVLCTGAAMEGITWTGYLSSLDEMGGGPETRFRRALWASHPVLLAQQQVFGGSSRSEGRRSGCGLTEERERRQLRIICGVLGTLLVLCILCRGIGIVLLHTDSHAANKGKHYVLHSQKNQEDMRSSWNFPAAGQLQVTSPSDSTKALSATSLLSPSWYSNVWARMSTLSSHERAAAAAADVSVYAQPAATPTVLRAGLASFCKIAHFARALLLRLSVRRRRSPEAWVRRVGHSGWGGETGENTEKQQQHEQRERGNEDHHVKATFTRTRWRRRERRGASPIGTLLLYTAYFIRKIIAVVVATLQIFVLSPLLYLVQRLIYVLLRISASFACTAVAFVFVGRLILERLKAFRIACTPVPSSFVMAPPASSKDSGNTDSTASGNSNPEHFALSTARVSLGNISGGDGNNGFEALDTSVVSELVRSLAEFPICRGNSRMERQEPQCPSAGDEDGTTATACADRAKSCSVADEEHASLVVGSVTLGTVGVQGFAGLGHLSGAIFRRSLYASKAVAAHVFPLISAAASAAVSAVVSGANSSSQLQQEAAVMPERDVAMSHQ